MKTLHVNLSEGRSYDIHIERGLLKKAGQMIRSVYAGSRIAIITDSNVEKLYAQTLEDALHAAGFVTKRIVFPAGEKSKNLAGLELLYDGLLSTDGFTLTRTDLVVALGGGVTGDMADLRQEVCCAVYLIFRFRQLCCHRSTHQWAEKSRST